MEALNEPENKWYIREIPRVYTVGQTFPIVEVQPPQSRKIKFYIRDRLMLSALRYYKSKGLIITVPLSSAEKNNYKHDNELMRAYGEFHFIYRTIRECSEYDNGELVKSWIDSVSNG